MRLIITVLVAILALPASGQTPTPVTARDYYNELNTANVFQTYADEYVCFYDDDIPSFAIVAKGEDVLRHMEQTNKSKPSREMMQAKDGLFLKTYYKGLLSGDADWFPRVKEVTGDTTVRYRTVGTMKSGWRLTATYTINWTTNRIWFLVETGSAGERGYSRNERFGKCELIHPWAS